MKLEWVVTGRVMRSLPDELASMKNCVGIRIVSGEPENGQIVRCVRSSASYRVKGMLVLPGVVAKTGHRGVGLVGLEDATIDMLQVGDKLVSE